jgi:hypothetical protein
MIAFGIFRRTIFLQKVGSPNLSKKNSHSKGIFACAKMPFDTAFLWKGPGNPLFSGKQRFPGKAFRKMLAFLDKSGKIKINGTATYGGAYLL